MSEPIFKSVFGDAWDGMPRVFKRHYANRPFSDDVVTMEGVMDISCAGPVKWLAPFFRLVRLMPPFNEKDVRVTVHLRSGRKDGHFHFDRIFYFTSRKPYRFRTTMRRIGATEMTDVTSLGSGWRCLFSSEGRKVVMRHNGYALPVMGKVIPLPLEMMFGEGYAEEIAVDDDSFDMFMHMTHKKWGRIYEYRGRFTIAKDA